MTRGLILDLTPAERIARALSLCVVPSDPAARIMYCSDQGRNGGGDPAANTCATFWRDKTDTKADPRGRLWCTADCAGFALWAYGMDRWQPAKPEPWLQQQGLYRSAKAGHDGWRFCPPTPGCIALIVDEVIKLPAGGTKVRRGHVGLVTRAVPGPVGGTVWYVAHCSPSNHERFGQGIGETTVRVAMGARQVHYVERASVRGLP